MIVTYEKVPPYEGEKQFQRNLRCIAVAITNVCNMQCPQCAYSKFQPEKQQDIPADSFERMLYDANGLGVEVVRFLGLCEPTLHPQFERIMELSSNYDTVKTHLFTNGTSLLSEYGKLLLLHNAPDIIEVCLDAWSADVYEKVRGKDASFFDKLKASIEDFATRFQSVKKGNWQKRDKKLRLSFVTHEESKQDTTPFIDGWRGLVDEIHFRLPHNFCQHALSLTSQKQNNSTTYRHCRFVEDRLFIGADGQVHICPFDFSNSFIVGNIAQHDKLSNCWSHPLRKKVIESLANGCDVPDNCRRCSKCF